MTVSHQLQNADYHLKPAELKKVIYAPLLSFRDRCILKCFAQTGLRRSELAALDVRDIDFDRRTLEIRAGKGSKSRTLPLSEDFASDLRHLVSKRKTGAVFLSQRGSYLAPRQVNWIVARAGELAGVKNPNPRAAHLSTHLFRHSFARLAKKHGMSIESLANILGHTNISTTLQAYGRESFEDVQQNYDKLVQEVF